MGRYRNETLRKNLTSMKSRVELVEANAIPKPDTQNRQGHEAYSLDKWLRLLSMLNVLKLDNQYYRSEVETVSELRQLVTDCAKEDAYLTAQCIVYSRCVGEGMRTVNHLAAVAIAPFLSGQDWGKRFYSLWDKRAGKGGVIFRPDDMAEIIACYTALNDKSITNAMKKGFKSALEKMDSYSLLKYKSGLIDVINLVHPSSKESSATVDVNGEKMSTFDAIMKGLSVSADTWEVAQSDAGQEVAKAVKEGKITKEEGEKVLKEAKAENWNGLLTDGKLGILAALRNMRNILAVDSKRPTIEALAKLVSDADAIRKGKIMPYQIDMALEVLNAEFSSADSRYLSQALLSGYEASVPNLKEMLTGRNLVIVDMSGSMSAQITDPNRKTKYKSSCMDKAALIAATIAKATNADIIRFGDSAEYVSYNINSDVFSIAKGMKKDMGATDLQSAWKLATRSGKKYERVFILSDNECNRGSSYAGYMNYVQSVGSPYVYSVDMAAYGTTQIVGDKVRYYYGYGFSMFDDIAKSEFNPSYHLEKVRKIVI